MNSCEMDISAVPVHELGNNCSGSFDVNFTIPVDNWRQKQLGGYPVIYPICIYHLYPMMVFGRIVHVIWYIIGFIGNLVSLKIWTLKRMKRLNSSALYLIALTICDILYQILHVFFYLKYFWGLPSIGITGLCQVWNVFNVIPQYASQIFVLGFTIERFISIIIPFKGERFSRTQRAPKIVMATTAFVIFIATPQAYFWAVDGSGFCEIKTAADLLNAYTIWSFVTESIIFFIVPFVTLLLNIFVLRETRISLKRHRQLTVNANGSSRTKNKGKEYRPSTKTLLCISFFRILTQLPVSVTYTMQNMDGFSFGNFMRLEEMSSDPQWRSFLTYWGTRIIVETIGASHHALSIFIFYASTKQFRNEISNMYSTMKSIILRQPSLKARSSSSPSDLGYAPSVYMYKTTRNENISNSP